MLPILFTIVIQRSFDMNKIMKKVAIAAAVAGALGGISGAAQAITLSRMANGVVVPYVLWDTAAGLDTAIGVTTTGGNQAPANCAAPSIMGGGCAAMHAYFYNVRSQHEYDWIAPMTSNDFYGFNWSQKASSAIWGASGNKLDGMKGYMILRLEGADPAAGLISMFADAAMITSNWSMAAFIPVVSAPYGGTNPVWPNDVDGYPAADDIANAAQVAKPQPFFGDGSINDITTYQLDLRYYVGPALGQRTDFVVWVDRNHKATAADPAYLVAAEVFDESEQGYSSGMFINDELNVWEATKIAQVSSLKSGFITLRFPVDATVSYYTPAATAPDTAVDSVIAFSLIYTSNTGIQTALAHERF